MFGRMGERVRRSARRAPAGGHVLHPESEEKPTSGLGGAFCAVADVTEMMIDSYQVRLDQLAGVLFSCRALFQIMWDRKR